MHRSRFAGLVVLALLSLILLCTSSSAQHFVSLTDRQWVELAVDMIRKGVQQEDTTKVFMVFAPEVLVKGEKKVAQGNLTTELQAVFDNSSNRKFFVKKPHFPREDSPLYSSDFWDFDILGPEIRIEGDSAVVDCELVLWGARPGNGADRAGRREKVKLIFAALTDAKLAPPSGEHRKWLAPRSGNKRVNTRTWKLVGFQDLLDFLMAEVQEVGER